MIDLEEFAKFYTNANHLEYHVTFFKQGLNAIIKRWLYYGCQESPEEINSILEEEYKYKNILK